MNPFELKTIDAIELLRERPHGIDCLLTDVAYESLEKHRKVGTTTRLKKSKASSNEWFPIFRNERFPAFFEAAFTALRPNRHFYFFCDQETMFIAVPIAIKAGFTFHKPLVWNKYPTGGFGMGYHYRAKYELVLFFEKGPEGRPLADLSVPDVLEFKCLRGAGLYPTQKPVELGQLLVRQSTRDNEIVCDPFMGSGAFGEAALLEGRRFIGGDVVDTAVVNVYKRLRAIPIAAPSTPFQLESK